VAWLTSVSYTSIDVLENMPLYELFEYDKIYTEMYKKKPKQ